MGARNPSLQCAQLLSPGAAIARSTSAEMLFRVCVLSRAKYSVRQQINYKSFLLLIIYVGFVSCMQKKITFGKKAGDSAFSSMPPRSLSICNPTYTNAISCWHLTIVGSCIHAANSTLHYFWQDPGDALFVWRVKLFILS